MGIPQQIPQKLDWVASRAACSVQQVFNELQNGIDEDIAAINSVKNLPDEKKFRIAPLTGGTTIVVAQDGVSPSPRVKIGMDDSQICAEDATVGRSWRATVGLNDAGRCVLRLNGRQEIEQWQFRKMVLQRIFFGDISEP